jgi:hypothetical protein
LNLPTGKYNLSIKVNVTRKKWLFPFVYKFSKWNDDVFTPNRTVQLNNDMLLTAEYKVALGATLTIWTKTIGNSPIGVFNRLNEFYKKYPLIFWLISVIIALRLWGLIRSTKLKSKKR